MEMGDIFSLGQKNQVLTISLLSVFYTKSDNT